MQSFGIIMFKGKNGKPWMDEQPFQSVDAIVEWIYSGQIDDPNDIQAIIWCNELGTWNNIIETVAEFVWQHYDGTDEHCHRETIKWFRSFNLPCDELAQS